MKRLLIVIVLLITLLLAGAVNGICTAHPELSEVVIANNAFTFDLFKKIMATDKEKNIFFSPYSISMALTMTYAGAKGNTAEEMASVLHYADLGADVHQAFHTLMGDIEKSSRQGCQLYVANSLWGQYDYKFRKEYLELIAKYYSGGFNEVDFIGETEKTRNKINDWVSENTGQKIEELIRKVDINANTRLVLTNAIYFKGDWASQFEKELTQKRPFYIEPGNTVDVQMMFQNGEFLYGEPNEETQILELPYKGEDLSMVIILPSQGLEEIENKIDSTILNDWLSRLEKREIGVCLPRFKFQSRYSLGNILQSMGMCDAFDGRADFSGMTGRKDLSISKVIHQADIDVNEEGTEAAAATAVIMGKSTPMLTMFMADHPFIFLIRHRPTNTILFIGRLMDPTGN